MFEYQLPVNRTTRDYEARIVVCNENEVTAIVRDITERKAREAIIEEERARIARDLHDGLAQNLYFVGLKLDYLYKKIKGAYDPEDVNSELCALKKTVQANIDDVRRTIFSLRPVELGKLGFGPAVRKYISEFGEQTRLDSTKGGRGRARSGQPEANELPQSDHTQLQNDKLEGRRGARSKQPETNDHPESNRTPPQNGKREERAR